MMQLKIIILILVTLDRRLYENISVYDISYKNSTFPKPLHIRSGKIYGEFIYLLLYGHGLFDKTCDMTKYQVSKKYDITYSIHHTFGEIRTDSYNYLPIETNIDLTL